MRIGKKEKETDNKKINHGGQDGYTSLGNVVIQSRAQYFYLFC